MQTGRAAHHHSNPLLEDLAWPTDQETITKLHGPDWLFYLTAHIRNHLITKHLEKSLTFEKRDPALTYEPMEQIMKIFSPSSLLLLYRYMVEYYKVKVVSEELDYNEEWYFTILKHFITLEHFEQNPNWFWDFALNGVIFTAKKSVLQITNALNGNTDNFGNPTNIWLGFVGEETHHGAPHEYIYGRFPHCLTTPSGNRDGMPILSPGIKEDKAVMNALPSIKGSLREENEWGMVFKKNSPFSYIIRRPKDVDHFYLSLYNNDIPNVSFEFLMALDILQYQWTRTDWANNFLATKKYWQLKDVDKKAMRDKLLLPYTDETYSMAIAMTPSNQILSPETFSKSNSTNPLIATPQQTALMNQLYLPPTGPDAARSQSYPQIIHELSLSLKVFAADMIFDYSPDESLAKAYAWLSNVVHSPHLSKKQRSVDFVAGDHLKRKIDLFNSVRQQQTIANEAQTPS